MSPFLVGSYIALWVLCVAQALALLALYNHFGRLWFSSREGREKQGPAIGERIQPFTVRTLDGRDVAVPSARPVLLLLASTDCPECRRLREPLGRMARARAGELDVVVVCAGDRRAVAEWAADVDPAVHVAADMNYRRASALRVGITPYFIGAAADGTVRTKGLFNGPEGVLVATQLLLRTDDAGAGGVTTRIALAGTAAP